MKLKLALTSVNGVTLATQEFSDVSTGAGAYVEFDVTDQAWAMARAGSIRITFDDTVIGSPGAVQAYHKSWSLELAEDQFRRGVDESGVLDPEVVRCHQTSLLYKAECNLRHGHDGYHEALPADTTGTVHTWGGTPAQRALLNEANRNCG